MNCCTNCSIEDKILYCCGINPLTKETKKLTIGNKSYHACPELDQKGECKVYDHLPRICREYQCHRTLLELERNMQSGYLNRMIISLKSQGTHSSKSRK